VLSEGSFDVCAFLSAVPSSDRHMIPPAKLRSLGWDPSRHVIGLNYFL
jgi:hypothetical protein